MSASAPAYQLFDLVQSHRVTALIHVAAQLSLAELLRNGPQPLDALAMATGADRGALGRLLVALCAIGICARAGEDRYARTEMGACLDGAAENSVKGWSIFEGELLVKSWAGMFDTIMSGKNAAELQGYANSFDLMGRTPENVGKFNAAMVDHTRLVTPDILRAYDFSGISRLMDVGGGTGEFLGAIAQQNAKLSGTIFDLSRCAEAANTHLQQVGVSDRVQFVAGDFFKSVPAIADVIILKSIIHDWNDARSISILRNCREALPDNGKLLLIERLMSETPAATDEDKAHVLSDLNMLRGPGGLERTKGQYRGLLEQSGFVLATVYPAGRFNVMEAHPA